jgi:tetratricopeptide (TPR) repeat protein
VPLSWKDRADVEIKAGDWEEGRKAVVKAFRNKAHLVIWGDVQKEEQTPFVTLHLTTATQLPKARIDQGRLREFPPSFEPDHLTFRRRVADEMEALALLLPGLAYYNTGDWTEALRFLKHSECEERWVYEVLSLYNRAEVSPEPLPDLLAAKEAFEMVKSPVGWTRTSSPRELHWTACLNRANVLSSLGELGKGQEAVSVLREANAAYKAALNVVDRKASPLQWAMTQNNRGVALEELGIRVGGCEGKGYLLESEKAYQSALEVYRKDALPQDWAMTQNNRGVALQELGMLLGGTESQTYLNQAIEAYENALTVYDAANLPQDHQMVSRNLEKALSTKGSLTSTPE